MCAWYFIVDHQEILSTIAKRVAKVGQDSKESETIIFWDINKFAPKLKAGDSSVGVKEY